MADLYEDMNTVAQASGGNVFADPLTDFKVRQAQIANRRKLADQLVQSAFNEPAGQMVGRVYAVNNPWGAFAKSFAGSAMNTYNDKQEAELALQQRMQQSDWSKRYNAATDDATRQGLLTEARDRGLKYDLEQQFAKAEADRVERGEQAAAERQNRAEIAEANRIDQGEQKAADRVARSDDLRYRMTTPNVNVHVSGGAHPKPPVGYEWNEDGTELRPIKGGPKDTSNAPGKPLSSQQEKSALELGGQYATVQRLAESFKPEYSGDLRSSIERQFGNLAGGLAPQSTQDMTRWWADQSFMDELPQRHELFGAALTPTEQKSWASAAINPSLSPKVIKERFETRRSIMENALTRMRASAVAGGKSGQQFDAATGRKPNAPNTGAGRTLVSSKAEFDALPAGAKWETPDGRKGTK